MQSDSRLGKVVVAPEVLLTIVRQTVLSTEGVVRLSSNWPEQIGKLLGIRSATEGIAVEVDDDELIVDVHVIASADAQMLEMGRTLQNAISRSITDIVGLDIKAVNIHIEDVEQEADEAEETASRADCAIQP